MPEAAVGTVHFELLEAQQILREAGVSDPARVATRIWAEVSRKEPGAVWITRNQSASPKDLMAYRSAVARHADGEPVAYVVGTVGFRRLDLSVDRRVLIPRPETEGLVQLVLDWSRGRWAAQGWGTVADIGTGSGAIALCLAHEGRYGRVIATDVSVDAVAVAQENLGRVAPHAPVEFRLGQLLEPLGRDRPDIIVSNPPYVSDAELAALDPAVREYEPWLALSGGVDGMGPTRHLVDHAPTYLARGGLLAVELDSRRAADCLLLAQAAGFTRARIVDDVFGRARYLMATVGGE